MPRTESVVGSKEELYPPKALRRALGIRPGMRVKYEIERGKLVVEPVPTVEELLAMKPTVTVGLKELRAQRRDLSRRLEGTE